MTYPYVIFDLDGTLLDTLTDLYESVNIALTAHGYPVRTIEEVRTFVGNGVPRLVALSVPAGTDEAHTQACLATFKEIYQKTCQQHTAPYEGVLPLLKRLRDAGVDLAIVSNKLDAAVKILNQTYFQGLISVAIGEQEDKGIQKKPCPDMVLAAMTALGADPSRTVYVGDSEVDILTAKNARLPCLSVTWGFRTVDELTAAGATQLVHTVEELWAAISGQA